MFLKEMIISDGDPSNLFLREDIIEGIEILPKDAPIKMKISCYLIIYVLDRVYAFSWESDSFHKSSVVIWRNNEFFALHIWISMIPINLLFAKITYTTKRPSTREMWEFLRLSWSESQRRTIGPNLFFHVFYNVYYSR